MEWLNNLWNWVIYTPSSGDPITGGDTLLVVGALFAGYLLSRAIEYILARKLADTDLRSDAIYTIKRVSFYAIFIMMFFTVLSLLGIPLTMFAFATGALALGIGFGAQNIINNFISGWILLAERPIRIGDFIEIEGSNGTVERVGTRSTQIRRVDGVHMLVPNSKLLENTVVNWTLVDRNARTMVRVGVAYGSDVKRVKELLLQAVTEQPEVLREPPAEVVFDDFGDSALIFDSYFWCDAGGEKSLRAVRSEIRFRVTELFHAAGVVIAFPQQDVHLSADQPLRISLQADDAQS